MTSEKPMPTGARRLVAYCDFPYRRHEGRVYAEQAFASFLAGVSDALSQRSGELVLIGRLDPQAEPWHFELPESMRFVPLPHYPNLSSPARVLAALSRSIRSFWRVLDEVEAVWLFGPNPLAVAFALAAFARGRRVTLGIRQEYVSYVRNRHPGKRWLHAAALMLDGAFRLLSRRSSVVVVGPALAERYAHSRRLLDVSVALVGEGDLIDDSEPIAHSPEDGVSVLSVGRLDNEKNPLLLADALAELCSDDGDSDTDWHLTVCGEGPLEQPLRERLKSRGVAGRAQLRGFVPAGPRLRDVYRESDLFLHASHTEGVPQVLFEAFAAGLPVVATDVGGVAATVGDAALLIPPDDPGAAAAALRRLAGDDGLREQLARAGLRIVREHTLERQCERLAEFLLEAHPTAGTIDAVASWMRNSRLRKLAPRRLRRGAIALTQYPDTRRLTADWRSFREYRRLENPPRRMRDGTREVSVRFREMPGSPLLLRPATEDDSLARDALFRRHHLPPKSIPSHELHTIWDLGANVGLTMAHMATLFPRARIVGVELDADNAALCRKNIAPWQDRCELVHAGVWPSDGTVEYVRDPGRAQSCRIGSGGTSASAPAISLNTLLDRTGARRVDYVKMDIEGAEAQVLKQATEWAQQVRSIKVEIHYGYTVEQCVEDLERLGFSTERILKHRGGVVGIRP